VDHAVRIGKGALIVALASLAIVYGADYLWVRYKRGHPNVGDAFGAVTFYYSTRLKSNRIEIFYNQPQTEACVRSLFPHFGERPCWVAARQSVRQIE